MPLPPVSRPQSSALLTSLRLLAESDSWTAEDEARALEARGEHRAAARLREIFAPVSLRVTTAQPLNIALSRALRGQSTTIRHAIPAAPCEPCYVL